MCHKLTGFCLVTLGGKQEANMFVKGGISIEACFLKECHRKLLQGANN
jgi:hypothetical protein